MINAQAFAVCSMVRESAETLSRFIRHYKAIGAAEILLFYDGPLPADIPPDLDGAQVIPCDAAFWAEKPEGSRPISVTAAQEACFRTARAMIASPWLFVTDADEFLFGPETPGGFLTRIPAAIDAVRIPTAEAVWGPGDDPDIPFGSTYFRLPQGRRTGKFLSKLLYGEASVFYRSGLIAHAAGKHFVRRDASVDRVGNHNSYRGETEIGVWADKAVPGGGDFRVAHFDAVSFPRWVEKWRRRYSGENEAPQMHPVRHAQKALVRKADAEGEAALYRLFLRLNTLKPWQAAVLRLTGSLKRFAVFSTAT